MTRPDTSSRFELSPVQFSRLARRGVLLGLSLPQLVAVSIAVLTTVIALYSSGASGVAWTTPIWGLAVLLASVGIGGRKLVEWSPVLCRWGSRAIFRQLAFRKRVERPRPAGTLALPGDAAALREWVDDESGAAMVHDPHLRTLTAVLTVSHPAFVLLDPAEQHRRVAGWGRVLAGTCRSGRISRLQVSERTLLDSGTGLDDWWDGHGADDGSWAAKTYHELIERAGPAGERHATTISLALDMHAAAKQIRASGGGMRGAAAVLRQEMEAITAALRSADLTVGRWQGPAEVATILRSAYDPSASLTLERHPNIARSLADAGPLAVTESWDGLRTDTAFHTVLWISEWPRSQVFPGFLSPLVLSNGVLRTIALHYIPVRSDHAARDIRRKKTELISDAHQRRRIGQIEDAAATAEYDDILQQEADLTAGHGVLRTIGLVSISARTRTDLDMAVAAIEQAAIQASCEVRTLVGQQAQAFAAAALPLCRPA
ncbi:SCO6880 family protein [Microbacterium rhizosphaerae]|uniref:SCO6880 family protein n=1 Tax=Microbacterium rhizosphaerae TaxID=1678237 RepID=A0ABZ0SQ60_9MICO|nr:SCO6880 family protein [Microbacterium rhizosphaerae]WPR91298.1 SCO6880 family protein [Microbacterium rhizosphaerae]